MSPDRTCRCRCCASYLSFSCTSFAVGGGSTDWSTFGVAPLTRLVFAIGVVGFAIGVAHFERAAEGNVATDKNSSDEADQTRPGASSICTRRK
jgi:hypothetical protein